MYKIIVWGMGAVYNRHVNLLRYYELKQEIQVIAITSSDELIAKKIDGYDVVPTESIKKQDFDYVMIMNDRYYWNIVDVITCMGIDIKKILHYKILDIPNMVFEEYIKVKDSNISIISNNCWGGIVYNTLGLECLSPFKNLCMKDEDYLKLLNSFEYYMQCDPGFGGFAIDIHSKKKYPILKLDDLKIHCNHDDEYEIAVQKWNRRRKKINRDFLFVEMYTDDLDNAYEFASINIGKTRICFVPFKNSNKRLYYLEMGRAQKEFWEAVNSNAGVGGNSISYNLIKLLNGENADRRE